MLANKTKTDTHSLVFLRHQWLIIIYYYLQGSTKMLLLKQIAVWLLTVNAAWDFMCAVSMLIDITLNYKTILSEAHFGLWITEIDHTNRAAKILFSVFVFEWGIMRMLAALSHDPILAFISYGAEALILAAGIAEGHVHFWRGAVVLLGTLACCLFIVMALPITGSGHDELTTQSLD